MFLCRCFSYNEKKKSSFSSSPFVKTFFAISHCCKSFAQKAAEAISDLAKDENVFC